MENIFYEQMIEAGKIITECVDTSFLDEEVLRVINKIKFFCTFLEKNRNSSELINLHRNMRDLKCTILFNRADLDFSGQYDIVNNVLYIDYNYLDMAIYHELFHMASRCFGKKLNAGFLSICFDDIKYFGINEGYTDLLAKRYFQEQGFYESEKYISYLLEKIVGVEDMEKFYFSADVDSLISSLSKYSNNDVLLFLEDFDYISEHFDDEMFDTKMYFIGKYLLENYYEKLMNMCEDGFSYERFIYEMSIYITLLNRYNIIDRITSKTILFDFMDENALEKCLILSKKM